MKRIVFTVLAVAAVLSSCQKVADVPKASEAQKEVYAKMKSGMSEAGESFALKTFAKVAGDGGDNVVFSPLSLGMDLAMLQCGAAGDTQSEIASVLGLEKYSSDKVADYYRVLADELVAADGNVAFKSANSIWKVNTLSLKNEFENRASQYFLAGVNSVDNLGSDDTRSKINQWVKQQTDGQIDPFLDRNISGELALLNAVCFKAKWGCNPSEDLVDGDFYGAAGKSTRRYIHFFTQMVCSKTEIGDIIALNYGDKGAYSFVALMPAEGGSVKDALAALSRGSISLADGLAPSTKRMVDLYLPEFEIESGMVDYVSILEELGMRKAFSPDSDFSSMTDRPDFKVQTVKQKARFKVDREGTTASAGTMIGMDTALAPGYEYPELRLDHPFLFFVCEKNSGSILFAGVLAR